VEFDTSVICHVFMYCLGSSLLQDMLFSLHVFAFEGQNMKFTVDMLAGLLAFEFYIVTPSSAVIRTVCKYSRLILITEAIFKTRNGESGNGNGERGTGNGNGERGTGNL